MHFIDVDLHQGVDSKRVGKCRSASRDDERMVVKYEGRLSDCSQDGMNDRKREALICYAWLVWYDDQELFRIHPTRTTNF